MNRRDPPTEARSSSGRRSLRRTAAHDTAGRGCSPAAERPLVAGHRHAGHPRRSPGRHPRQALHDVHIGPTEDERVAGPGSPGERAAAGRHGTTVGSANCSVTLPIGSHTITALVGARYTGDTSALVEVASPSGSFVTGGGYLLPTRSAGAYRADPGSQLDFAFHATYTRNGRNPTGHAVAQFESGGRTYEIRSTALDSLGLSSGGGVAKADLRSKANLFDVTDPANPVSVAGGLTLQLTATDRGEPGSTDSLAITLWSGKHTAVLLGLDRSQDPGDQPGRRQPGRALSMASP
jgi:hypothetical protein